MAVDAFNAINRPDIASTQAKIAVVFGAGLVTALFALWLLHGDGALGLAVLGATVALFVYLERRNAITWHIRAYVAAAPRTAATVTLLSAMLLPIVLASSGYAIHVLTMAVIFAIMAVGLNVHLGGIGLINIGYGGLFAVGAYAAALASNAGYPFWLAVCFAVLACIMAGVILGLCAVRTSGDYFALVTLGFGLIVHQLIINMTWLTNGTNGIGNLVRPSIFGLPTKEPMNFGFIIGREAGYYYICLVALIVTLLLVQLANRSWIGRTWSAMREDPIGTSCFGVNIPLLKVQTVAFGSAFAGVGGTLYAHEIGFISPDDFTLSYSIELIAMVILGGIGNMWGVVAGAVLLVVVPEKLRILGDYRLLAYGALLVLLLVYRPTGLFAGKRRE